MEVREEKEDSYTFVIQPKCSHRTVSTVDTTECVYGFSSHGKGETLTEEEQKVIQVETYH